MANIIEPCCAERQLSYLLREERGHAVVFQTNGDVTLEHWMKAVMLMAGAERPRSMILAVPELTEDMTRIVGKYLRLEWVKDLRLMTTNQLNYQRLKYLADRVGCSVETLESRIEFAADANIPDGLLAFCGMEGTVIIQGRLVDSVTPGLTLYAGVFGRTGGMAGRSILDAWDANFKARRYKVAIPSQLTGQPQKKKANRKKKNNEESTETMAGTPQREAREEKSE